MAEKAILFDTSQCSGCKGCQAACKCWNDLPSPTALNADAPSFTGTYQNPPDLSGVTRLVMTFSEEQGGPKGIKWAFGRRSCQHCGDAPCATICPAGAIFVDEATGLVTTDAARCIGCRFCASACPFDVPRYAGDRGVINKCTGCVDRVANGLAPACVTTCQPGALSFGDRDEMVARAEERAAVLRERGYADAVAYGADEVGGLHVIQVLKYGAAAHGQRPDPAVNPAVQLTQVMKPVTGAVTGLTVAGLAAMFALGAGYKRDRRAYNPATGDTLDVDTREVIKHGDGQDTESVKEHILENLPRRKGGDHE
ncbi:4Fe-4S dicluster domain-containing protein [Adlercreutzia faecimuris]|uniref:4Fe-4S dicluster domain-containing protein n=1 Tax=Adlercreutzia faecimuris TaxID=2897341 RepID=A0ABS9WF06_9ACTN|nr:4Fe-4S dicluster domain-containing protein [Adlercreutzia sp. JBNU-10]MCI2241454.1 4Fe-4S dicluster domain-containing protein [Adlercreutzia sp. JBNU-10]